MSAGDLMNENFQKNTEPNYSTVVDELNALDWQLSEIGRSLNSIEMRKDATGRESEIRMARHRLNTAVQRSHRAQQIASGLRVPKST